MTSLDKPIESETYVPFVTMTNTALHFLKSLSVEGTNDINATYDILLQHNDPTLLYYKYNNSVHRRKPDNIFVTLETARALHNKQTATWEDIVTNYATTTHKGLPFRRLDWGDALCSVEHKRTRPIDEELPGKLEEDSLLPLKDPNRFVPKRSSQKNADEDPVGPSTYSFRRLSHVLMIVGSAESRTNIKGGSVRTTGSSHAMAESSITSRVHVPWQEDEIDWENSVAVQSAEYGLGRLCCSYDMLHAFTLMVVGMVFSSVIRLLHIYSYHVLDGTLHISWYDHEGIITTNGFCLSEYLHYYLALLYIFQRFDRSAWGRCGDDNLRSDRLTDGLKEITVTIKGKEFTFDPTEEHNVLRKPFAIGGRATTVYTCQGTGEQKPGHASSSLGKKNRGFPNG